MNPRRARVSFAKLFSLAFAVYPPVPAVLHDEEIIVVVRVPYELTSLNHQAQMRVLHQDLPLLCRETIVLKYYIEPC